MAKGRDDDRARKTIYVTGFNAKLTTKHQLKELFTQGAPVVDITMFDTHAYILFQDEISVPYCLALFNEVELHGEKLRLNSRSRTRDTYSYMNYLAKVRGRLRDEYTKLQPPDLPPKDYPKKKNDNNNNNKKNKIKNSMQSKDKSSVRGATKRGRRNKTRVKLQKVKSK